MVIQATWKKNGVLPKGSWTYDSPDALPLSHGRLVGANQIVGSYNKLLQPVATETFFRLKRTVHYYWSCACDPLSPPPCQLASYTRPCSELEEQLWMEGGRERGLSVLSRRCSASFSSKYLNIFATGCSTGMSVGSKRAITGVGLQKERNRKLLPGIQLCFWVPLVSMV